MSPQHTGHVVLITGANAGVGLELTRRMLREGADVIALIRSDFPAEAEWQAAQAAGRLRPYLADLTDFSSLRHALEAIQQREPYIDVLFNNAGAAFGEIHFTPQGHEAHFAINTLAPFVILMELKPLLLRGQHKTVINTSSNALLFVRKFSLTKLIRPTVYQPLWGPYGASKLALSLWTAALADALVAEGLQIRSVCPGPNKTNMTSGKAALPKLILLLRRFVFKHPSGGAQRTYDSAFGDTWQGVSGIFINKGKRQKLRFLEQAPAVLASIQQIYQQQYLGVDASLPLQI